MEKNVNRLISFSTTLLAPSARFIYCKYPVMVDHKRLIVRLERHCNIVTCLPSADDHLVELNLSRALGKGDLMHMHINQDITSSRIYKIHFVKGPNVS